jgi:hypothetical protein
VVEAARTPLAAWESFYVIIGSSAAALTGLQFVVIALIADSKTRSPSPELAAFGTPTIVHFCAALLVSGILSAPWPSLSGAGFTLGTFALAGVAYAGIVIRRAHRQTRYRPVLEDWIWHAVLPFLAYSGLLAAAITLPRSPQPALFLVATVTLLLVFIGIHNAWDSVTYIAIDLPRPPTAT